MALEERKVELEFRSYGSDKVYNTQLIQIEPGSWQVKISYGRRWNPNNVYLKPDKPVTYSEAEDIMDRLVASKIKKGYEYV